MRFSYLWLKEHAPLTASPQALAGDLLKLGFEVSALELQGPHFSGVVVAEVLSVRRHENADRLSVCAVTDGSGSGPLSVVCGAPNVAAGAKVALARPGAVLPDGRRITKAKIRGVPSEGMICSAAELGIEESAGEGKSGGILVLDPAARVGADFSALAGGGSDKDASLDVDITPNRPDCLSHRGLARELAAFYGLPLSPEPPAPAWPSAPAYPVQIAAPEACPEYWGLLLEGLSIGPSPSWLSRRLAAVGLKSVNNLVDAANFILFDLGQPLHAFDAQAVRGRRVTVRFAAPGESLAALDARTYELSAENLVIADEAGPIALAGVMGGSESAVTAKTTSAFLECARFEPAVVRKSGRRLRLISDSSYRYERGTDPAGLPAAAARAVSLILEIAGPKAELRAMTRSGRPEPDAAAIQLDARRIDSILGCAVPVERIRPGLAASARAIEPAAGDSRTLKVFPRSPRRDIRNANDLAEEVARMWGYDNIPSRTLKTAPHPQHILPREALRREIRLRLSHLGFCEAYCYDLVSSKILDKAGLGEAFDPRELATLTNPLSADWTHLRPSLLPGLLESALRNLNRGAAAVRLFEIGWTYRRNPAGSPDEPVIQEERVAALMLGPFPELHWDKGRRRLPDFFEIKGVAEDLAQGAPNASWRPFENRGFPPARGRLFLPQASLVLESGARPAGACGLLSPAAAGAWGLDARHGPAAILEIDLGALDSASAKPPVRYVPPSPHPLSWRDIALVVAADVPYSRLEEALSNARPEELSSFALVDEFEGAGLPEGTRSRTLRLFFQSSGRTLTDPEVSAKVEEIVAMLASRFGAKLRE